MPRPRKIDDVRFARLWLEGVAARDIARAFDVSRHSVSAARLRLNLPARRPEGDLRDRGLGPLSRHAGTFARLTVPEEVIAAAYGLRAEQVRAVMSGSGASDGLAGEEQRGDRADPGPGDLDPRPRRAAPGPAAAGALPRFRAVGGGLGPATARGAGALASGEGGRMSDRITAEERALIDAALAGGPGQVVPAGLPKRPGRKPHVSERRGKVATLAAAGLTARQMSERIGAKIGGDVLVGRLKGARIFTLTLEERATCPRSCAHLAGCYGNAMPHPVRWQADDAFEDRLSMEIAELCAAHDTVLVRLHILGDFYSARYVGYGWDT
jgi:hypothetical protein